MRARLWFAICIVAAFGTMSHALSAGTAVRAVQGLLDDADFAPISGKHTGDERAVLRAAYSQHGFRPFWHEGTRSTPAAAAMLQVLAAAQEYGLDAGDYGAAALAAESGALSSAGDAAAQRWEKFDVALSGAALRFVAHLHSGRIDPRRAGFDLREKRAPLDASALLQDLSQATGLQDALLAAEPTFLHYRLLRQMLSEYRSLARQPGLTDLPPVVGRGSTTSDRYAGAVALRRLLIAVGDLPSASLSTDDPQGTQLGQALGRFQERHGLDVDGVLGPRTFAALTTPMATRVRQIELTLERWRWLPEFSSPPVIVNIPQFKLFAFRSIEDRAADILPMSVIVGRSYAGMRTPVFVGDMKYVVFRPYWDVPASIVRKEVLPALRARPAYLARNRFEIVRGPGDDATPVAATALNIDALARGELRLRQLPGPDNALGLVKFMFPNEYNVYLHSTPARQLFAQSRRAFSHGCIRLSDPLALAVQVLQQTPGDWSAAKVEAAMNATTTTRVNLSRPVRVMVLYGTALVTEAGKILFFDDIYGHDRRLETLLARRNDT